MSEEISRRMAYTCGLPTPGFRNGIYDFAGLKKITRCLSKINRYSTVYTDLTEIYSAGLNIYIYKGLKRVEFSERKITGDTRARACT